MKRPNPLPPNQMTPAERRAALCALLALGLIRLRLPDKSEVSAETGEFPLHNQADKSGSATPIDRRTT